MPQKVSLFWFRATPVRIIVFEQGLSFWAVAADVVAALGYRDARSALSRIALHHKATHFLPAADGGEQDVLCIDEPGISRLAMRSNKPEAKLFIEWFTAQVLPAVRPLNRRLGRAVKIGRSVEARVFDLFVQGVPRADIARRLRISDGTVSLLISGTYRFSRFVTEPPTPRDAVDRKLEEERIQLASAQPVAEGGAS